MDTVGISPYVNPLSLCGTNIERDCFCPVCKNGANIIFYIKFLKVNYKVDVIEKKRVVFYHLIQKPTCSFQHWKFHFRRNSLPTSSFNYSLSLNMPRGKSNPFRLLVPTRKPASWQNRSAREHSPRFALASWHTHTSILTQWSERIGDQRELSSYSAYARFDRLGCH
jgi:hypothetical protein